MPKDRASVAEIDVGADEEVLGREEEVELRARGEAKKYVPDGIQYQFILVIFSTCSSTVSSKPPSSTGTSLTAVEQSGELFLSNAIAAGKFALRACIVNFRTSNADVDAVPEMIARLGAEIDRAVRPEALRE